MVKAFSFYNKVKHLKIKDTSNLYGLMIFIRQVLNNKLPIADGKKSLFSGQGCLNNYLK